MGKAEHAVENSGEVYAHLTPLELLESEISTERYEVIAVSRIVLDAGIVDEGHVADLAESMIAKRKQLVPLLVRARIAGPGSIHYDVIDGFHRSYGLVKIGKEKADAKVVYGCDDEELNDLRVLSVNSVKSVQYPRVAQWMQLSFSNTELAKRGYIMSQIFSLAVMDTSGRKLGLSEEEAEEAKKWAHEKAKIWNRPVSTIWSIARTVEAADPKLVYQVRLGGGRKGKGVLTAARLGAIATPLAGRYELQQKVAETVLSKNIQAKDAMKLAKAVADAKDENHVDSILENAESFIEPTLGKISKGRSRETRIVGAGIREEVERESEILFQEENETQYDISEEVSLREEIQSLQEALKKAQEKTVNRADGKGDLFWWRTFPDLTATERRILSLAIDEGLNLEGLADEMKVLPRNIIRYLFSGLRKYSIYLNDLKHRSAKSSE